MFFCSIEFWLMLLFAALYLKGAQMENASPVLWVGLSLLVSLVVVRGLGWGWIGVLVGQIVLMLIMGVYRAWRE